MAIYKQNEIKTIREDEAVEFHNKCESPFSVGMGVVFKENGQYLVTVDDNKVVVSTIIGE